MPTKADPALEAERFRPALAHLLATKQATPVDLGSRRSPKKLGVEARRAIKYYREHPEHFPEVAEWDKCIKVYRLSRGIVFHLQGWHNGRPWNTNSFPVTIRATIPAPATATAS